MFADDIINDAMLPTLYRDFHKIQMLIGRAQKFALARDFALAADGLVDNIDELKRIAPFCRIPYPITWIEFAQSDRKHWMESSMHFPTVQAAPANIAFLCVAKDPKDMTSWTTLLMWSFKNQRQTYNASVIAIDINLNGKADSNFPAEGLEPYVMARSAPFAPPLIGLTSDETKKLIEVLSSDWGGEVRYLFAVLGLLNAQNVPVSTRTDLSKLNKARARRGHRQLQDHTVLTIRATHKASLLPPRASSTERGTEIRASFIRGHFKHRKTGIFWWNPHLRGNRKRGFVDKDYTIT